MFHEPASPAAEACGRASPSPLQTKRVPELAVPELRKIACFSIASYSSNLQWLPMALRALRSADFHSHYFSLLVTQHAPLLSRSVNPKSRLVPPYVGDESLRKFESIKAAIPKHCFEHSYLTSFRYLLVDVAASAALFYAVSVLEQTTLHPAVSFLL